MSLQFIPPAVRPNQTMSFPSAPSVPSVPDTLRIGLRMGSTLTSGGNLSSQSGMGITSTAAGPVGNVAAPSSSHPLEARLAQWNATQRAFKLENLRRVYGVAEPIRREMEALIVEKGEWKPQQLGGSAHLHTDILNGNDMSIDWEDVFTDDVLNNAPDMHSEFEARLLINA